MVLAVDDIGSGLPVVLLHAFPLSREMWQPQRGALSDVCRLLTPDLPGFGNSPLLGGSPTDYNARLVRDGQMDVLKPLVASGAIHIVAEPWVEGWDPVKARDAMADALKVPAAAR